MSVVLRPEQQPARQAKEPVGREKKTQLTGEPATRFHGMLTSQLHKILEGTDPGCASFDDLERSLREVFEHEVTLKISATTRDQPVLVNSIVHAGASELLASLAGQRMREIIAGLEEVITKRELQGDYWPEGRLNLGIAYACLGRYEDARRWLEDAVNMLKYPSYIPRSEQMAA